MKYCYSKFSYFLQFLLAYIAVGVMIILIHVSYKNFSLTIKNIIGSIGLAFVAFATSKDNVKQYVELNENFMLFQYRFLHSKLRNSLCKFNVMYEDVISITCKKIPLIGITSIKINAKNIPENIKLTFSYCKRNEMYKNICKNVLDKKPEVTIDNHLLCLLEK